MTTIAGETATLKAELLG